MKRLISKDPMTNVETWFEDAPEIDGFHIHRTEDYDPILKALAEKRLKGDYKGEHMWYAGSIPPTLWEQWAKEAGVHPSDPAMIEISKKKLNDGEFSKLRGGDFRI